MAGDSDKEDRTETASARRLQQAREEGQAPLSREVAGVAVLASAAWLISVFLPKAVRDSSAVLTELVSGFATLDVPSALRLARTAWIGVVWPFVISALLVSAVSVLGQTSFLIKTSALRPDFSKLNPLSGLARVFGPHTMMEAGKSVLKVAVMAIFGWRAMQAAWPEIAASMGWSPSLLASRIAAQTVAVMVAVLGLQAVIAAADLVRTRMAFNTSMRMTKQDQRDEARDSDGDPHVKGKLKQMRMQRARKRMMNAVPKATVVVTNPTHYAVALVYERGAGGAPRIVAKGMDELAARIRKVAEEAGVPLVANPPLARALYPLPLDREIPPEHFKAVAELIAYVWKLRSPRPREAAGQR
jgi:flagellar biosynthetic protein FlhB